MKIKQVRSIFKRVFEEHGIAVTVKLDCVADKKIKDIIQLNYNKLNWFNKINLEIDLDNVVTEDELERIATITAMEINKQITIKMLVDEARAKIIEIDEGRYDLTDEDKMYVDRLRDSIASEQG